VLSPAFRICTVNPLLPEDDLMELPDLENVMTQAQVIGRSVKTIREADYLTADAKHAIFW